jgi:pimeloyl-ACP methyl ester carboxylesterase
MTTRHRTVSIGDVEMFYRDAGPEDAPVLLLLHGFPTSSHMFRDLIPMLSDSYRVIAPDLPGFGNTRAPTRGRFEYTFENLSKVVRNFVEMLGLTSFAMYVFDYGAPIGYRLARATPEKVVAIISQNGNAYLEGFSGAWDSWMAYWRSPSIETRNACRESLSPATIRNFQYLHGTDPELVSPDGYTLDIAYMSRKEADEIQLDLILDYRTNVAEYPSFPKYFRTHRPPLLAIWGKNDPAFLPAGADALEETYLTRRCNS